MAARNGCFAVRRGKASDRLDVNFNYLKPIVETRYSRSRYHLTPIWEFARRIQYGCSQRATEEPIGVPILRMNNLQDDGWDLTDLKYVELTPTQLLTWQLEPGDIVFNRTNSKELVGKCEVFNESGQWVFASYLMRLETDPNTVRPRFVADFLSTPAGRLQIDRESRQIIGMSNINAEEIRGLVVPLPPVEVQDACIQQMDEARVSRQTKLHEADELLAGVNDFVLEVLGLVLPNLPQRTSWAASLGAARERCDADFHSPKFSKLRAQLRSGRFPLVSVSQFCPRPVSGFAAGRADQEQEEAVGVPHIRPLNITGSGELTLKNTKFVPHERLEPSDVLRRGEVLFNNTNSTIWVGKSVVFDLDRVCACSNHITRLVVDPDIVLPGYVAACFNALRGLGYFGLLSTNFNNQAGINVDTLKRVVIPKPPMSAQRAICDEVLRRRERAHGLRHDAERLWYDAKQVFERSLLG